MVYENVDIVLYGKNGGQIPTDEAHKILESLDRIKEEHGSLTPEYIVQAARPVDHPLHAYFEWNDTIAAQQYRLQQARSIICSIRERVTDKNNGAFTRRYYSSVVTNTTGAAYVQTSYVMTQEDLRQQKIEDGLRRILYWKELTKHFTEFDRVHRAIDETTKELSKQGLNVTIE